MASSALPELVRDFELNATIRGKQTVHNRVSGRREAPQKETWERRKKLGRGGFGSVWLEHNIDGGQTSRKIRAVKELRPGKTLIVAEYVRELEALAKFSQEKVGIFEV